ncbi:hypothetical protein B0A50_00797 [Salinomyces thailandicus]|uniref:2-dehydropantoate 2-reductase n=1 Tax=Salinomyces thailandicus TaxID=706561 RepID=A0A4U0UD13_9PEZI|nr:hypothetical protein B0A50_00797 [Salinomyces thailandica]
MAPKILLHGSGAIGTIYVYLLLQAGCSVTAVCRSNYDAAKAHGFTLNSALYGQNKHVRPTIVRTPSEAAQTGPYDYVIVCTKALPEAKTAEVIRPVVTEGRTTIVLIQNGIGIEEEFAAAFPHAPLLSTVVYLPTTQTSPGHVEMGAFELLEVGTFPAAAYVERKGVREACDEFVSVVKRGGSNVRWYAEIQEQRWSKLLVNASWNPICALSLSRDVAFLDSSPAAGKLVKDVMEEVVNVAQALGYRGITHALAQKQLERAMQRKGGKGVEPSMLADVLAERRMEVEVILGNPIQVAKRVGVAAPVMETLYALAKALDEAMALRQRGKSLAGDETRVAKGGLPS